MHPRGEWMDQVAIGIDIGTSATKVCAIDTGGAIFFDGVSTSARHPTKRRDRLDPKEESNRIWSDVRSVLGNDGLGMRAEAVCITAHGQSAVMVEGREPIGRMIPWWAPLSSVLLDEQEAIMRDLISTGGLGAILHPRGSWLPARLKQWMEESTNPLPTGIFTLQLKDLLGLQLCGNAASDHRSMRGWLDPNGQAIASLVDWVGMEDPTPLLLAPDAVLGEVDSEGEALSGIRKGAQVLCGLDDLSAGISAVADGGRTLLNLANTSEHLAVRIKPVGGEPVAIIERAIETGLSWLPPIEEGGSGLLYASTNSGGRTLLDVLPRLPGAPLGGEGESGTRAVLHWLIGEMGERPTASEMVDVPGIEAEIHGRRGLDPEPGAIGGWDATVDDVEATPVRLLAWRVFDSLIDSLEPIRVALSPFVDATTPVRLGGGLAMIGPLLESRAARWSQGIEVVAGPEVSALGAARIAAGAMESRGR